MRNLAPVVTGLLVVVGVAVGVIWTQESIKKEARETEFVAQRREATRLAACVADKASDEALREISIAWYQPQGIRFKKHQARWKESCSTIGQRWARSDDLQRAQIQLERKVFCISDPEELDRGLLTQPDTSRLFELISPLLQACDVRAPSGYVMPTYMTYYSFVTTDLMDQARFRAIHEALMAEDRAIMRPFEEAKARQVAEQQARHAKESNWLFKK